MGEPEAGDLMLVLDATTRRFLPLIYAGVGGFYLFLAASSPFFGEAQSPSDPLVARWAGSAAFGLLGGWFLHRFPGPPGWANHLLGLLGVLVVTNSLFLIAEGGASFVFALMVALLGWGLFMLSVPWVVGLCALGVAGWAYVAGARDWGSSGTPYTVFLLAVSSVAVIVQVMRVKLQLRLEALKVRDLERVRQEEQLLRERALNEQRRRIVRMTAHELSTPLTPVMLQAHMLARGELSVDQRKTLETLQRNLDRLQQTIEKVVAAAQQDEKAVDLYSSHKDDPQ